MNYTKLYQEDLKRVAEALPFIELLNGKSLLITGTTGLIGSAVADFFLVQRKERFSDVQLYLSGRSRERVIDRFTPYVEGQDYTFVFFDAANPGLPDICPDYIIHAASNAHPAVYVKEPVETMLSNLSGVHALLKLSCKCHSRFVYLSSSEVYGIMNGKESFSEEDCGRIDLSDVRSCYPEAKRASELLCLSYISEYDADAVIVRPGYIYGPTITGQDSRAAAQFIRSAAKGDPIVLKSSGTQMRSYCYAADCVSAILCVMLAGEKGKAYNIAAPESTVSIRSFAEYAAAAGNCLLSSEESSGLERKGYNKMPNSVLNVDRLVSLGWNALFGIEEGVRHSVAILRGV